MEQIPQQNKVMEKNMSLLKEQYPGVIREDSEYFIYDVTDKDGNTGEVHVHKWERIPVQVSKETTLQIPVWQVIDAELRFRSLFGRDDYSLVAALQQAGVLQ